MNTKSFLAATLTAALFTTLSYAASASSRVSSASLQLVNESFTQANTGTGGNGRGTGRGIGGGHGRGIGTGRGGRVIHQ